MHRTLTGLLALAAALACGAPPALSQPYPNKPIRLIIGNPPAGTNDILARMLQNPLQEILGQSVIIENRPGGAGMIAPDDVIIALSGRARPPNSRT